MTFPSLLLDQIYLYRKQIFSTIGVLPVPGVYLLDVTLLPVIFIEYLA